MNFDNRKFIGIEKNQEIFEIAKGRINKQQEFERIKEFTKKLFYW
jgi:DNA modification methylase